ncbi:MAG: CsgE family curli-type amyloid fiber assembly protein [Balneolaceae bacterium]|nr:CsgE family curli-type amyloid fiber assembly protein [Balneolaceae bacterium]
MFLLSGGSVQAQHNNAPADTTLHATVTNDTLPSYFLSHGYFNQLITPGDSLGYNVASSQQRMTATSQGRLYGTRERGIADSTDRAMLNKLRKAFGTLMESKPDSAAAASDTVRADTSGLRNQTDPNGLNLGGMILDETITRIGSNFYSIFYQNWEDPSGVGNFMITVGEQPIPSLGSIVTIEIDDRLVYRQRLQPRYYQAKRQAEQAVQICRRALQAIKANQNQITGYQP